MGITDFTRKHHITPVLIVCLGLAVSQLALTLEGQFEKLQVKAHAGGVDGWDIGKMIMAGLSAFALAIVGFMNRMFGRYMDQREEDRKLETAHLLKQADDRAQTRRDFGAPP